MKSSESEQSVRYHNKNLNAGMTVPRKNTSYHNNKTSPKHQKMKRSFDSILFDGNQPVTVIDEALKRKSSIYGNMGETADSYRTLIFSNHKEEQFISEDKIVSHGQKVKMKMQALDKLLGNSVGASDIKRGFLNMIIVKNEGSDDLVRGRSIGRSAPRMKLKSPLDSTRNLQSPNIIEQL